MPKEGGGFLDFEPLQVPGPFFDVLKALKNVVEMALGINASWESHAYQFHGGSFLEHDRADLAGSDPILEVEFRCECLPGKLGFWDMRKESSCINVNGVPAGRPNGGNSHLV